MTDPGPSAESPILGVILWDVDRDLISEVNSYSSPVRVGGMRWRLFVSRSADTQHLSVYLAQLDGTYVMESVDVAAEFKLHNHKDDHKSIVMKINNKHARVHRTWGIEKFAKWNTLIDEEHGPMGFIKNYQFTLKAEFSLSNFKGSRKRRRVDFTDPNSPNQDVALVMEGKRMYIDKQYLSIHSPVFERMFFGDFAESNQNEIGLRHADKQEFLELLNVIHPPFKKITDSNAKFLVELGDRLDIDWLVSKCEQFHKNSTVFPIASRLALAAQYRLSSLQDSCIDQLKNVDEVKDLKNSEDYDKFSAEIKLELMEKIMNF